MAYYSPNTPSPSSSSQIGYSYKTSLVNATTNGQVNVLHYQNTVISSVPVGVWIISGNVTGAGTSNAQVLTEVGCTITVTGLLVSSTGFSVNNNTTDNPCSYMYCDLGGVFHSNGTASLTVQITVRSSSSTTCSGFGAIILTKIA